MHSVFDQRRYLIPFRAALLPQVFTDVLVIGSGVAGLRAAIAAADHADVIVIGKSTVNQTNTAWAQGGIAAVLGRDAAAGADESLSPGRPEADRDTIEGHVSDTLSAGADLCDERAVRQVINAAPERVQELIDWGMAFDRAAGPGSALSLGREGGHSRSRILHADGDATGRALAATLHQRLKTCDRARLFDDCFVLDLITLDDPAQTTGGRCLGAITHHPRYGLQMIWAAATILATGGCGQVFRETTNPPGATGDGLALAYRAGARLADMAFMQFHPTTLYVAGASRSLITEAVRGEGALLIDRNGDRFMPEFDPRAELAPRDIVSRAILTQIARTNYSHAFLDCRPIGNRFQSRFPGIHALLEQFDLDPTKDPIPIHPSAHYMIGGVWTDHLAHSSVHGLYVCGEAACTGMHGGNRLASNSLLEGLVMGEIAGQACREETEALDGRGVGPVKLVSDIRPSGRSQLDVHDVRSSLRSIMWRHVGIERNDPTLKETARMLDFWANYMLDKIFDDRGGWQAQNMLLTASLITRAALWRQESRGVHSRTDHPDTDPAFRVHDQWQRGHETPTTLPPTTQSTEHRYSDHFPSPPSP